MLALPPVLRNTAVLLTGTTASKGLVFLSYVVLTRGLGPEGFGRYALLFAYLAFFELLADAGLDSLLVREASGGRPGMGRRLGDALLLRGLLAVAAVSLAFLCFPLLSGSPGDRVLVVVAGGTLLASPRRTSLRALLEIPYRTALRMELPTFLAFLAEAAHLGILAFAVSRAGVAGAVAAQALAPLPFAFVLAIRAAHRVGLQLRPEVARLLGLLRSSAPLLGGILLNVVLVRIDVLMLHRIHGPVAVGLYSAPVRLVEVANLLPGLLMASVFPLMAASHPGDPGRVDRLFRTSLRVLTLGLVPLVAVEIAGAEPLLRILFGTGFEAGRTALAILAAAEILIFADIVLTARLIATGQEKRNLQFVFAAAASDVALNLVLIPRYGPAGAAAATLAAYAVRVATAFAPADTRELGRATCAAILPPTLAGAAAFGAPLLFGAPPPVAVGLGAVLYAAALLRPGLRTAREILGGLRRAGAEADRGKTGDGG